MRLVRWSVRSVVLVVLVLAVCLDGVRAKEAAVEQQKQQAGGNKELGVLTRVREITGRITNTMKGYMRWSGHDKPDSGPKGMLEEELESEILEILDSSVDEERKKSHTYGRERLEDSPITEDALCTSQDNLPNVVSPKGANDDALSDALSDVAESSSTEDTLCTSQGNLPNDVLSDTLSDAEESPRQEGVTDSDKSLQSRPRETLNDHPHHDLSADPALPTCDKDETSGSCSSSSSYISLDPLPVAAELSNDVEMEMDPSSVPVDSSEGRALEGVRIGDAVNGGADVVEEDKIPNTDNADDSEEAFNSISADHEAMLSDSTSDEDTDIDTDGEGDALEGEDNDESEDDDAFNQSDVYSDLSDTDDSSDGEMLYGNEAELSDPEYGSRSEEAYDSDTHSDEEDIKEEPPADVEGEAEDWKGKKSDSEAALRSQFTA